MPFIKNISIQKVKITTPVQQYELWSWGNSGNSPFGNGIAGLFPTKIESYSILSSSNDTFTSTINTVFFIRTDNTLWGWGDNTDGVLGDNTIVSKSSPIQIGTLTDWSKVYAGITSTVYRTFAIKTNGTLWGWGSNFNGFIGDNTLTSRSSPVQIGTRTGWSKVAIGNSCTIALRTDGTLWGWGNTETLGLDLYTTFTQIGNLTNWSNTIESSNFKGPTFNTIKSDGTLWGWGGGIIAITGGTGDGTQTSRSSPVQIGTLTNWLTVSNGGSHALAVKTDGTLWSWGRNTEGQLGNNTVNLAMAPIQIGTLTGWASVSAGNSHSIAITTNGTLWGWGLNTSGELGDGTVISRSSPVQIGTLDGWSKISSGWSHTMAIRTDGTMWGWGNNGQGQLGINTITSRSSPVQIGTLTNWSKISSGYSHTMAIKTDGTLWVWGGNAWGQLGDNTVVGKSSPIQITIYDNWSKISAGFLNSFAIRNDGTLWGWGQNTNSHLGLGTYRLTSNNNGGSFSSPIQIGIKNNWSSVFNGTSYTISIDSTGNIYSCGDNTSPGMLGQNNLKSFASNQNQSSPIQIGTDSDWRDIDGTPISNIVGIKTNGEMWAFGHNPIAANTIPRILGEPNERHINYSNYNKFWSNFSVGGTRSVHGIRTDGTLWAWGINDAGQLGINSTSAQNRPLQVGKNTNWSKISAGGSHTIALTTNGTLWGWGFNASGQLGQTTVINRSSPVQIGTRTDWSNISTGVDFSHAITTGGTLWGWGLGTSGQLGDNTVVSKSSPVQIGTLTIWSKTSNGALHTMALRTNGTLWGWGRNTEGQLGDSTVVTKSSPVQVGTLTNWSDIVCGGLHTIALKNDGTIWGWGSILNGQTGVTVMDRPIKVNDDYWSEISAAMSHTIAVKSDGTLWGWGLNNNGQLGDGTVINRSSPVQIGTQTNWQKVSTGTSYTMAIKTDGTLWGWGANSVGSIGNNSTIPRSSPVQIGTLTGWTDVKAGTEFTGGTAAHTLALRSDGTLWSWGRNIEGQLGHNNTTNRSSPVQVGTLTGWTKISAGGQISHAIRSNNTIWGWGLGSGNAGANVPVSGFVGSNHSSPIQIGTLTNWSDVSSGKDYAMATKTDGTLWGWGANTNGSIGDGTTNTRTSPVQIGSDTNWSGVEVYRDIGSAQITLARKTDGTLWSWGNNTFGQLGIGYPGTLANASRSSPVQVRAFDENWIPYGYNWSKMAITTGVSFAIDSAGQLFTWGGPDVGQSGLIKLNSNQVALGWRSIDGYINSPTQIGSLSNWKSIGASTANGYAIDSNNKFYAWGHYTALGDGTIETKSTPIQLKEMNSIQTSSLSIIGLKNSAVSTTVDYVYAIDSGSSLWGWGGDFASANIQMSLDPKVNATVTLEPIKIPGIWSEIFSVNMSKKTDNTLWIWGSNTNGQLGDNTTTTKLGPMRLGNDLWASASYATDSTQARMVIAIKTNGTLWAWGSSAGIGDGTNISRSSPVQLGTLTNWKSLNTVGDGASIAIDSSNQMYIWGGTLGIGSTVANNHMDFVFNKSSPIQLGGYNSVSTADSYTMAIKTDGTLWGVGFNVGGQLGDNTVIPKNSFVQIGSSLWSSVSIKGNNIASSGNSHAIRTDGTLWGWGGNAVYQVGDGTNIGRSSPVQIGTQNGWSTILSSQAQTHAIRTDNSLWGWGSNSYGAVGKPFPIIPTQIGDNSWSSISAENSHTMAIRTDGTLWGWGQNTSGNLGLNDIINRSSPVQVGTLTNWSKVSVGVGYSVAVKTDGTLWSWGLGTNGVLGDNTTTSKSSPVQIGTLTNWYSVNAGSSRVMAVKTDGTLWGWGENTTNILGLTLPIKPTAIDNGTNWSKVSAGRSSSSFTMAIKTDGTLWGWGTNTNGELGDGTVINRSSPVQIGTSTDWSDLSCGDAHTLALKTNGTIWSWGAGSSGRLGGNSVISRSSPTQIGTLTNWSKISAGNATSGAIKTDGTLWGWGSNVVYGMIGDNTLVDKSSPIQIGTLTDWLSISTGFQHTLAIKTNSTLWAWGRNSSGQLGDGTTISKSSPIQIGTLTGWSSVSSGNSHSMAIRTNGTLFSWGNNADGRLGQFNLINRSSPVQIGVLTNWSKVYSGGSHTMSIKTDGTLWGWGKNSSGNIGDGTIISRSSPVQIGTLTNWSNVGTGDDSTFSISTSNRLYANGLNNGGQLGLNNTLYYGINISSPVQIGTSTDWYNSVISAGNLNNAVVKTDKSLWIWGSNANGQMALQTVFFTRLGEYGDTWGVLNRRAGTSTMAIKTNGTLWAWGDNSFGQLGVGDLTLRESPVQVGTNTWSFINVSDASSFGIVSFGVDSSSNLWVWGSMGSHNGMASYFPKQLQTDTNWSIKNSSGLSYTMSIKTDGTLWGWGLNSSGQLGDGTTISKSSPIQIGTLSDWSNIFTGSSSTLALKTDGTLWGWGANGSGQLGTNNTTSYTSPVQVGTLTDWSSLSVSSHTLAIKNDGTLWAWGFNQFGQIGNGTASAVIAQSSPIQIGTLTNWSKVAAADSHSMAIKTDGTLWGWGQNTNNNLGNNTGVSVSSPVQIGTLTNWSNIFCLNLPSSNRVSIATKTDGTLWGWGTNSSGQLGTNNTTSYGSPVQIGTLTNWLNASISMGTSNTMAVKSDGTLWGWGSNNSGQIGIPQRTYGGTITDVRSSPIQIGTLTNWKSVSCGDLHTITINSSGNLYSWGRNDQGQLGRGYHVSSNAYLTLPIKFDNPTDWAKIDCHSHTMAIKTNGTLWAWGVGSNGQHGLGDPLGVDSTLWSPVQVGTRTDWSDVKTGNLYTIILRNDGTLWSTGLNTSGQLGIGIVATSVLSPIQIGGAEWSKITAGHDHVMSIKTNGTLWGWGRNDLGQVGDGTVINRSSPVQIGTSTDWSKIYAGYSYTMAIKTNGTLWGWGANSGYRFGNGTIISRSSPVQIGTLTDWNDIAIGTTTTSTFRTFGLKSDGSLWGVGTESASELGRGFRYATPELTVFMSPIQVGENYWSSTSTGDSNIFAVGPNSTLWAWGTNSLGKLGDTSTVTRSVPVQVGTLTNWSTVSAGFSHTMAIKTDGTLWGWGLNTSGQLGDNTLADKSSPVQIGTLTNWSSVQAAAATTFALNSSNRIYGFGLNSESQLGLNGVSDTTTWRTPVQIDTDYWSNIASSYNATAPSILAIRTNGTLWGWGLNTSGQLGDTSVTNRSSPVQIGTLTNWSKVSLGNAHAIALKTDGTLWSWGLGTSGQLGDNTAVSKSSPIQIGTLTSWSKISAGHSHSMAIKTDGTLWAWGRANYGAIDGNSIINRSSPVQIGTRTDWTDIVGGVLNSFGEISYLG